MRSSLQPSISSSTFTSAGAGFTIESRISWIMSAFASAPTNNEIYFRWGGNCSIYNKSDSACSIKCSTLLSPPSAEAFLSLASTRLTLVISTNLTFLYLSCRPPYFTTSLSSFNSVVFFSRISSLTSLASNLSIPRILFFTALTDDVDFLIPGISSLRSALRK